MPFSKQQGAALIIALIILLVVSMMGVSAMKGGIFHERMAFNAQSEEMTFQAAETAISSVIQEARKSSSLLGALATGKDVQTHCISLSAGISEGVCGDDDTLDSRKVMQAEAESQFDDVRPLANSDSSALVDFQFHTIGKGAFVASADLDFPNRNRQEWRKVGPGNRHFSVDPKWIGGAPPNSGD